MAKVSVIIVHWNVPDSLTRCLRSLGATGANLEIIVVDNASTAKPKIPKNVRYLQNAGNLGFPKGVNQGLKIATGEYILILNPDTQVPKDFFVKAVQFAKAHPDLGVMGPKFIDPDGTPQGSVFTDSSLFHPLQKYTPTTTSEVFCVSGGCMFIPKEVIEKVGLFTEEVFMYYEDMDYCRRTHKAGLKVYFNSDITISHEHGSSAKQNPLASDWQGYLWDSSLWYNGYLKHYLMWLISWLEQKIMKLAGRSS